VTQPDRRDYSPACERNREPILAALRPRLAAVSTLLELASGTGQHSAYFAPELPHLTWQPSDLSPAHTSIKAWRAWADVPNLLPPIELDLLTPNPADNCGPVDAIFVANLLHISLPATSTALAQLAGKLLAPNNRLFVYGPFRYPDQPLEPSNQQFVGWLKRQHHDFDIRQKNWVETVMAKQRLYCTEDLPMPANNRLLVWTKGASDTAVGSD